MNTKHPKSDIPKSQTQLKNSYNPITKSLKELIATFEKTNPMTESFKLTRYTPKAEYHKKSFISKPKLEENEVGMSDVTFADTVPANTFAETGYETGGGETLSRDSLTLHYIDESMRQLVDLTRDENPAFSEYLEQFAELPRIFIKEGTRYSL